MKNNDMKKTRNSREFLDNIIESSLDGIIATDDKGYITRTNKAFSELLKYEEDDVLGKHITEFSIREEGTYLLTTGDSIAITREYFDNQEAMIADLLEGGEIRNRKSYFTRKDGKIVPCEQNISALYDEAGKVNGAVGIIRDIAERVNSGKRVEEIRDFLDDIFQTAVDGIMVTDPNGFIIMINDSIEKITGYKKEDLIGKHAKELRAEGKEYEEKGIGFAEKLLRDSSAVGSDIPWLRKDGSLVYVERSAALLRNKNGEITGAVSTIRDITETKRAEKELKEAKEHLDNLIENSLDCIMVSDKNGNITKVNRYFLELLGYHEEEVIGKHVMECTPMLEEGSFECTTGELLEIGREFIDDANKKIEILIDEGKVTNWEAYYFRKDKKVVPIEQNIVCLYNREGERTGAVAIIREITERRKAEKELRETKDFLEKIIENSKDGILVVDAMGNILSCNAAIEQMSGFGKEKIIRKHASELIIDDKEIRSKILEKTSELFEKGFATYDAKYKSKEGKYLDVECTSSMIANEKGEYIAGVSIIRDISERRMAEREIREGKEFLEKIIQGSKDGILISDGKGYILSSNQAMEGMLGLSKDEIVGKHSSELLLDDTSEREKVLEKMGEFFKKGFTSYETRYKRKDGDCVDVECYLSMINDDQGNCIAGVSIIRDITERKKMHLQLLQSEKLRSLGELAGGVAHDFNNVLSAILGRAQLLKMQFKPPPGKQEKRKSMLDLIKSLEIIEKASSDGAETVRRIQEFARRRSDDKDFTQVNINELLDNVLEFTAVRWRNEAEAKGIRIHIEKEFSTLPTTSGSAAELREVFTNIINNALDAMPQGGSIQIKTFKKNNHISIKIKDTGVGIPEDIRNRIFDPFFTTKGVQSTGLGMSTSYGIINRHKGTISVDSNEGKGTTFTINIPISDNKIEEEEKTKPILQNKRKSTILVIEDEEEVRNLLADILIESGHRVETASDGSQGIELFKSKDFDMVFTDLGMPGMSGWEVAEIIKKINRKIPVAVITGWNVEMDESEMRARGAHLITQKPFQVNQILGLVQEGMKLREQFEAA
jgi:PAS domain S-box-containing protein